MVACAPDSSDRDEPLGPVALRPADEPVLSIGVVEGDGLYEFVRVTAAWKQANGRVVVLDPGKAALLFYDSNGVFLSRAGGRGQGPGEMQRLASGWPYRGDSIAVYDLMLRRVTIYDHNGVYARSFQNPIRYEREAGTMPSQSCCLVRGVFADGSFVGHPPDDIPTGPGPERFSTFTPWWISPNGAETHPIGTFESALYRHDPSSRSGVRGYATSYYFRYAIVSDRLIGGNGFGPSLRSVRVVKNSSAGAISVAFDTLPYPRKGEPFSADLQLAYERALRADYEANRNRYEGTVESYIQPYPETTPACVNITADADGHVWLERWTPEYGRAVARLQYDLVTVNGAHIATVALPSGSQLLWSGKGQVLLLQRDDMDVQYVRLYDLVTAPPSS